MNNHLWLMGISDKGAFNYSLVSYPVLTLLEVGNYRYDSDNYNFLLSSTLKLDEISNSIIPKELSFKVKLDNKKMINVSAKVLNTVSYSFDSNKYILHENIAEFTIDNNKFMGILEIGFNKDKKRIFNGKKLSGLKRK